MKIAVALLGATGTVGQKALALLEDHPLFEVTELIASPKNRGKAYGKSTVWREERPLNPKWQTVLLKTYDEVCAPLAISALPADEALEVEPYLTAKGIHVFSNARSFRMHEDVPLMIPEINGDEISLLQKQKTSGKLITNPNCSTTGLCLALAPLMSLGELDQLNVCTLQAISGAGYPGLPSLDILGNVVPFIDQEEQKLQDETRKILRNYQAPNTYSITANVHRVPVRHGHTVTIHARFKKAVTPEMAIESFKEWNKTHPNLYVLYGDDNRPQPLLDLHPYDQRAHIGRILSGGTPETIRLVCLTHNLVRGAAGAALLNMEHFVAFQKDLGK